MRHLTTSLALALLTVVAWCGGTRIEAQSDRQQLDVDGVFDLRLVSNGNVAVLVAQSGRSGLAVFRSVDGGPFVPTEFVVPPDNLERRIYGVWATTHGFFAVQHTRGFLPRLSRSVDGARWDTIDSPAFATPGDISGMVQLVSGDLLAVGALRVGVTPATPRSFQAAMWRSRDGVTWQRVELAGELAGASSLSSVATQGTVVVVMGQRAGRAVWRSDNGGASWSIARGGAREIEAVTQVSGRFVRFALPWPHEPLDIAFATSVDGREWRSSVASGLIDAGLGFRSNQFVTTASGVFLVGGAERALTGRPEWCSTEPTECTLGVGSLVVMHTATGDTWRAIDVVSLLGPEFRNFAITDTKAGTVIAGAAYGRIEIRTVPPASWSYVTPQVQPPPQPRVPPLAPANGSIEVGTVYRYPMRAHCGVEWLGQFNGRTWKALRQLVDRRGMRLWLQIQETLFGTIRLTDPDTIEYAIEGVGVVAVYGPTSETPPICL